MAGATAGDRIIIRKGILEGYQAIIARVNAEMNHITAAVPARSIPFELRRKLMVNKHKGYVPITLKGLEPDEEGEWDFIDKRILLL